MSNADFEPARLTVRLGALAANYRTFQRLSGNAAVAGVVKADGYGCGALETARTLRRAGCDTFFVARLSEGIAVRNVIPDSRIFVLDGVQRDTLPAFVSHKLTPVLNSLDEIALWSDTARKARTEYEAAIHLDTGMNRLGLPHEELNALANELNSRLGGIRIALLMSHLACADDSESGMNREQFARFKAALARLPAAPASLASSGGVLLGKDYVFDMVRPGIGLYGGNPQVSGKPNPFQTVALMTGKILQLRRVDSGGSVGYGATFRIGRETVLATVALGYADGLMRALSNNGFGAIAGYRAPVAGRVSMDLVTLDVTDVPASALRVGADVEFFGDTISLEETAAAANTANYELLTSLGPRIPRRYVEAAR
ncbi:MAG: alanine racemase [Proteobacteria bacterium]|nr:alanine racemase [Pseudomonadota bacterium]